jgi:hypothetical protein
MGRGPGKGFGKGGMIKIWEGVREGGYDKDLGIALGRGYISYVGRDRYRNLGRDPGRGKN